MQRYLRDASNYGNRHLAFCLRTTSREDNVRKLVHRSILLGAATIALCEVTGSTQALAGGFGVREQSALFLGTAFAGSAAGGDLSSMFC
jgi:hypothetical protein